MYGIGICVLSSAAIAGPAIDDVSPKVEAVFEKATTGNETIVISDADDDVPLTEMITRTNEQPTVTVQATVAQQMLEDAQAYQVKPRIKQYTNGPIVDAVKKRPIFRRYLILKIFGILVEIKIKIF